MLGGIAIKANKDSFPDMLIIGFGSPFFWDINWNLVPKNPYMVDILAFVALFFLWDELSVTLGFCRQTVSKIVGWLYNFGPEVVGKATINQ